MSEKEKTKDKTEEKRYIQILNPATKLCIACDLTLASEYIITKSILEWSKTKVDLHKRPTMFIIQKDI